MASELKPIWRELNRIQEFVLIEAFEESRLIDVLNGWADPADALFWNRKDKYVPALIEATLFLLERDLIEVWADPPDGGEGGLLPAGVAAEVVADPDNWWKYDPDEDPPPAPVRRILAGIRRSCRTRCWPRTPPARREPDPL